MQLAKAIQLTEDFLSICTPVTGEINFAITPPMDAAIFPDEIHKLDGKTYGLYMITTKADDRIVYIGISNDIPKRIYSHIGPGFTWARSGGVASFPNCTLADKRHWLNEATQELLRNAQFSIVAVLPDPPEAAALLEAFLVFWGHRNECKPEINVEF